MKKFAALFLLLLGGLAHADFVRDTNWEGGGDGTLDLTNSGDPVVVVYAIAETNYSSTHQGTAAIDTTAPESMTNGVAITNTTGNAPHGESYYRSTAKTGSTTIDVNLDSTWWYYAMLLEGFDSTLSDSCSSTTNFGTSFGCSVTVPANGIAVVLANTDTGATVSSWKQSATEREAFSGATPTTRGWAATKIETSGVTQTYGVDFVDSELGTVQVLVFGPAAGGPPAISLDDATPAAGTTPRVTAVSAPGGTLTHAEITIDAQVDETACESGATTTICDVALDLSKFSDTGDLNNAQWSVAGTIRVRDASSNWTATTPITIDVPANGDMVDLACTAGVNCDTGSEAVPPMTTNDDCAVVPAGITLTSLTTHCQPFFGTGSGTYTVVQFDESTNTFLEVNTINLAPADGGLGVIRSPIRSPLRAPVRTPIN